MIDPFDALRQRFRERAGRERERIALALSTGDRATMMNAAHKLHGSGATFGYPRLSHLAEQLELAAEAHSEDLGSIANALLAELSAVAGQGPMRDAKMS